MLGVLAMMEPTKRGVKCETCGQLVKLYPRALHHDMAQVLIAIYRKRDDATRLHDWVHVGKDVPGLKNGDYGKLRHWELIESRGDAGDDTKSSGFWRIAKLGIAFVERRATVWRRAYVFNNRFYGFETKTRVTIDDALGTKFSYSELMGSDEDKW